MKKELFDELLASVREGERFSEERAVPRAPPDSGRAQRSPASRAPWVEPGEVRSAHGHLRGDTAKLGAGAPPARRERKGAPPCRRQASGSRSGERGGILGLGSFLKAQGLQPGPFIGGAS